MMVYEQNTEDIQCSGHPDLFTVRMSMPHRVDLRTPLKVPSLFVIAALPVCISDEEADILGVIAPA